METREAAGFVIALAGPQPRFLLLRNARHGTWAPPKGHAEPGETPLQTARRETIEETGIHELEVMDGFEQSIRYDVKDRSRGSYHKLVRYFLALAQSPDHTRSAEHDDSGWFTLPAALERVAYPELKKVLQAAAAALNK
jgi:bis(5'-nucleosidyl)-tetraphosphatase